MSKNKEQTELADVQDAAAVSTVAVIDAQPDANTPDPSLVIVKPVYGFEEFQPADAPTPCDIRQWFAPGFNAKPYAFLWTRERELQSIGNRELTLVKSDTHGRWFKPGAFDQKTGCIVRGAFKDGYELYLTVRTAKAAMDEQRVLIQRAKDARSGDRDRFKSTLEDTNAQLRQGDSTGGSRVIINNQTFADGNRWQ